MKKILVSIIIIGAIAAFYVLTKPESQDLSSDDIPTGDLSGEVPFEGQTMLAGASAIYVAPQKPGDTVVVSAVAFSEPGFIMIHKSVDGAPGEILGTGEYIESTANMTEVKIDQELVDGEKYFAMLHKDDGNGEYDDPSIDPPLTDDKGNIYQMEFEADVNAPEVPEVAF